jgi:epoxyqueuosine reductase
LSPNLPQDPANLALRLALELGFDLAGLAPLRAPRDGEHFKRWLAAGNHADMAWLERNAERILAPGQVLHGEEGGPGCLLVVGMGHHRAPVELPGGGRIARYAAGRDYHNRMGKLLKKLAKRLAEAGLAGRWRGIVDAGPILERSHAEEAGLGFLSKAANLLHPDMGPWFFLGELLLDVDLTVYQAVPTPPPGSCGTCTACIDACPTVAITAPGVVDANRCISYQTIENRGQVPRELRPLMGQWVFGCDICSEVCPWGSKAPDHSEGWGTHPAVAEGSLMGWLAQGDGGFREHFRGSPLSRPGRVGLARNAAIVLGNAPQEGGAAALKAALDDDSPVLRETAGWALARAHGQDSGTRAAIERALAREEDEQAAESLRQSLDESQVGP